ncbi:hypothetical protein [Actinomycetospora straminea]|uniref:Uncharacterized protein n=1 Tax=Actinomycetospora straminea TaxID=663607 RepID=A0ABP9EL06_9PSEU|nr:hypothetical protein [Actinomycetospora straminea]MDD7933196.1 hypothetical protein [Actinomycetospora straminea]
MGKLREHRIDRVLGLHQGEPRRCELCGAFVAPATVRLTDGHEVRVLWEPAGGHHDADRCRLIRGVAAPRGRDSGV